jgi:NADH:ubiquinone oxidoreductase subunit 2 (subunit N)
MLTVLLAVALAGGAGSIALAVRRPRASVFVALAASAISLVPSFAAPAASSLTIREASLTGSDASRMLAITWSVGLLLLGLIAVGTSDEDGNDLAAIGTTLGAGLLALVAGLVALTVGDLGIGFAALGAGAGAAVVVPGLAERLVSRTAELPLREMAGALAACVGAALAALVVVSWRESSDGPLASTATPAAGAAVIGLDPAAMQAATGLAVLAMAAVVILRSGAIPGHLWAARLVGVARPSATPALLGWSTAAFTLIAVGWANTALAAASLTLDDLDRWIVIAAALTSVLLGGLAALLHDDLEHILGYSIVQDAGVALFAFAVVRTDVAAPLAAWLIASAVLKAGFAGWITVTRWTFGAHRVGDLRGWARRAPVLAAAYTVALLGSVGLPGMAIFDARAALIGGAVPGGLGSIVVGAAVLTSLAALGRVLVVGLQRSSGAVLAAPATRLGVLVTRGVARRSWSSEGRFGAIRRWPRAGTSTVRGNRGLSVAAVTVLLAVFGFAVAVAGAGRGLAT